MEQQAQLGWPAIERRKEARRQTDSDRRYVVDRRTGQGRRVRNRRLDRVSVSPDQRTSGRRDLQPRRVTPERRVIEERRSGLDRRGGVAYP